MLQGGVQAMCHVRWLALLVLVLAFTAWKTRIIGDESVAVTSGRVIGHIFSLD